MRIIDSSDASFGSIRELATEINAELSKKNKINDGIGKSADIFLCHFLRHYYISNPAFKKYKSRVLIQPIDGTVIEPVHVKDLNQFDVIITPANVGKKIMQDCGVIKPVEVVPNYYDDMDVVNTNKATHRNALPQFDHRFLFYHESSLQVRKNISAMVESYLFAFSDNEITDSVHLVIKGGDNEKELGRTKGLINKLRKQYTNPAKISIISSNFSKNFLRKIWSTIDCYISLAHMEGFGIPLLRMAINGKPIVTLRSEISGYMDFLNDENTYFIESKKCKLANEAKLIFDPDKSHWEDVESIEYAANILKSVYADYISEKLKTNRSALMNFRKDVVMERYNEIIKNC